MKSHSREQVLADRARIERNDSRRMTVAALSFLTLTSPMLTTLGARVADNVNYIAQEGITEWNETPQYARPHVNSLRTIALAEAMVLDNETFGDYASDYARFVPAVFSGRLDCITETDEARFKGDGLAAARIRAECVAPLANIPIELLREEN